MLLCVVAASQTFSALFVVPPISSLTLSHPSACSLTHQYAVTCKCSSNCLSPCNIMDVFFLSLSLFLSSLLLSLSLSLACSVSRKDRPISMGIFPLPGSDGLTHDLQRETVETPSEPWRFNDLSHPRCSTSLKVEHTHTNSLE